ELRPFPRDGRDRDRHHRHRRDQRELGQVLRREHLGRVSRRDVAHLVGENGGELVLGVAHLDQRGVHVDRTAREGERVHLGRVDDVEGVREEAEGRVRAARVAEARADPVHHLGQRREPELRDVAVDLLLELLPETDVAVDRVEVRMVRVHAGAAGEHGEREDPRLQDSASHTWRLHAPFAPPARTRLRIALGWTETRGPAVRVSSTLPPAISPERLSPLRRAAVARSPPSANPPRPSWCGSTSVGRLATRRCSGPPIVDTRRLSPFRMRARKAASPPGVPPPRRLSSSIRSIATRSVRGPATSVRSSFSTKPLTLSPLTSAMRASPRSPPPNAMLATAARGSSRPP